MLPKFYKKKWLEKIIQTLMLLEVPLIFTLPVDQNFIFICLPQIRKIGKSELRAVLELHCYWAMPISGDHLGRRDISAFHKSWSSKIYSQSSSGDQLKQECRQDHNCLPHHHHNSRNVIVNIIIFLESSSTRMKRIDWWMFQPSFNNTWGIGLGQCNRFKLSSASLPLTSWM